MLQAGILITLVTVLLIWCLERWQHPWIRKILDWFPAILFAYVIPALVTHLMGWDLSAISIHDWSKNFIMPMAILTVMSALSFGQLKIIGLRPIIVFVLGSMAISLAPIVMTFLSKSVAPELYSTLMDQEYWRGLVTMVGSWIGGSTSQLVLKEVVECPEQLFITILVMDNVLVNIWTILMFQFIRGSDRWNARLGISDQVPDFVPDDLEPGSFGKRSTYLTLGICILAIIGVHFLVGSFLGKVIFLSVLGLFLGNYLSFWNHTVVLKAGGILIIAIMAILGLKLRLEGFTLPLSMVWFSVVWLLSHFVIMTVMAAIFKLHMAWVPIASMANVGGISTAPAVTAAYNEEWMPHAIILAILSMVTGTSWGLLSIYLFTLIA